jgi:hypothetical protein
MKLEQRIGRVDRIGQKHVVRALNLALSDTVELRVREVLEEKLQRILDEFGVDKLGDVLDSEEGGVDFEKLFLGAVLAPGEAEARVAAAAEELRVRAIAARDGKKVLATTDRLDPEAAQKVAGHQMPFWTERMLLSWLRTQKATGAGVSRADDGAFDLRWPDGTEMRGVVFARKDASESGAAPLSIEDPRVRALITSMPPYAPGTPVKALLLPGISEKVSGTWSLWRVALQTTAGRLQRALPLFVSRENKVLAPTARAVWDRLVALADRIEDVPAASTLGAEAQTIYERQRRVAEEQGAAVFAELTREHRQRLDRERRRLTVAIEARRRAVERIGLPQVRAFRLAQVEQEEREWRSALARRETALPELTLLLMVAVTEGTP